MINLSLCFIAYEFTFGTLSRPFSSKSRRLCSQGIPASIYDQHHPEVSFTDRTGVSIGVLYKYACLYWRQKVMRVMFIVIIHRLDCGGAQFLSSVLPLLPNLTSLRWDCFSHIWHLYISTSVLKFKVSLFYSLGMTTTSSFVWIFSQYCWQTDLGWCGAVRGLAASYKHSELKVSHTYMTCLKRSLTSVGF